MFLKIFFPLLPCCQATFLQYQQLGKLNVWKWIKGEERRHLCCLLAIPFHCWEGVPLTPPVDSQTIKLELGFIHLHLPLHVLALERDAGWRWKPGANRFLNNRAGTDLRGPPVIFAMGGQMLSSHHLQWDDTRVKASTYKCRGCFSLHSNTILDHSWWQLSVPVVEFD